MKLLILFITTNIIYIYEYIINIYESKISKRSKINKNQYIKKFYDAVKWLNCHVSV